MIRRLVLSLPLLMLVGCSGGGSTPVGVNTVNGAVTITGATDQSGITVALLGPTPAVTQTDATGAYSFQAVLKGNYEVTASAPSTSPQYITATVTTTGLSGSPPPVVVAPLTLTGLGTITGTATLNGATTGNSGILVAAVGGQAVSTNDSGAFTITGVPVGTATVAATFAGYLPATSTSVAVAYNQTTNISTPLTLRPGQSAGTGEVTGSVTNSAEGSAIMGLSGVTVWLNGPTTGTMTQTNAQGVYTFSGLTPGAYTITAVAASTVQLIESTTVTLPAGATQPMTATTLAFSTLGTATGIATFGNATTGNGGILVAASGASATAVTNNNGSFTLANVPTGPVKVVASAAGFASAMGTATVVWNMPAAVVNPTPLVLTAATSPDSIAGQVTVNGAGAGSLSGISVTAVGGPYAYLGLTDTSGNYMIQDVASATYAVTATVPYTVEGSQMQTVDLADGGMGSANFTFTATGTITGVATLGGAMTGNAGITIQVPGTSVSTTTGPSGDFTLMGVPTGSQTVLATYPGYAQASGSGVVVTWQGNNTTLTMMPLTLTVGAGGSGTITGTITFGNDSGVMPPNVTITAVGPTTTSVTSSAGSYTISGLAPGTYTVTASVPSTLEGTKSATVNVGSGGATGNLSFTAVGTVPGTATLASATSSAGILVAAAGTSSFQITQMNGSFTLTNVPVGTQTVVASYPGYGSASASVSVVYNQPSSKVTLTLAAGGNSGTISGTVSLLGASANAIPVAAIGPTSAATLTNTSGMFSLSGLAPGNYEIVATVPSTLEGTVTTFVTLIGTTGNAGTLSFTPLGVISGTATLGGQATGNTGVLISVPGAGVSTVTSDNGSFLLRGVPTTATMLVASYPGYVTQSTAVSVSYDMTTPVSKAITLVAATSTGSITGTVTVSAVAAPNVIVTLTGPVGGVAVTSMLGTYAFPSLPDGTYSVIATALNTVEETQQAVVNVTSAQPMATATSLNFTGLGTISGTATLAGASSSAGIAVGVVGQPLVALTNASGAYTITRVPVGAQSVIASYGGYSSATDANITVGYQTSVTAPAMTLAVTTNPGSISGSVVLAPNAAPLANAEVALSGPVGGIMFTGSTGAYSFTNLPNGSYTLTVTAVSTVESIQETTAAPNTTTESAVAGTVTFHALGALSGTATLGSSTGNAGITVAIPGTSLTTTTNNSGSYLIENVPIGAQTVAAYYPGYVGQTAGATATYGATQTVPTMTLAASTYSGTVTGTVSLSNTTTPSGLVVTLTGPTTLVGQTISGGAFSFTAVAPGSYMVTVNVPSTVQLVQAQPVTLTASSNPSPLTFSFTALGTVTGQVTLAGQAASGNTGIIVSVSGTGLTAVTNSTGNFTIQNVPTGVQTLLATMPEYAAETVSTTVPYNATTTPAVGFANPLALSQYLPTTTVEGVATLLNQSSSAGITVAVQGTALTTTTTSSGAYSIANVPVGVINLTFTATGGYTETLQDVVASQNTTGTIDGPALVGSGVQTYLLTGAPMDVPMGTRLFSGASSLPVVSPSGNDIVEAVPSTTGSETEAIATLNAAVSNVVATGEYTPTFEAFGTNGQYLFYAVSISPAAYDVYAYQVSSGASSIIATGLPGSGPSFFQAGTSVAWYSCTSTCNGYSASTSGASYTTLFSAVPLGDLQWFQISPNGAYVFWLLDLAGTYSLDYETIGSASPGDAADDEPYAIGIEYITADSKYIVYSMNGEYYSYNMASGVTVALTTTSSVAYAQTQIDDFIFEGVCGASSGLCSGSLSGGSSPLSPSGGGSFGPLSTLTAASGGGYTCFVPSATPYKVWCANAGGGTAQPLSASDQFPTMVYTTGGLFVGWTNNGNFSVASVNGGTVTTLAASGFRSAAPLDTTHLVYLAVSSAGLSVLELANLGVFPPTTSLLASNVESYALSPDGTRIAYIDSTDNWLYSIPSGGSASQGTPTVITRYASSFEWVGTGHQLLFVRHGTLPPYVFQDGVYSITAP